MGKLTRFNSRPGLIQDPGCIRGNTVVGLALFMLFDAIKIMECCKADIDTPGSGYWQLRKYLIAHILHTLESLNSNYCKSSI